MVEDFVNKFSVMASGNMSDKTISAARDILYCLFNEYDINKKSTDMVLWQDPLPEAYKAFIVTKRIEGLSEKTIKLYMLYIESMLSEIRKPLEEITPNDIRVHLYSVKKQRNISDRTLDSRRAALSSFFAWSAAEKYIPSNPMATVKAIKYERKERTPLDDITLEKVRLNCATLREKAIIEVLYSSGCRVTELITLNRNDVNMVDGSVVLFGKGGKHRVSYLSAKAVLYLKMYLDSRNDTNEALFVGERSPHERLTKSSVERVVRIIGNRAGVGHLHPHLLRHTIATNLLNKGMAVTQLKEMLGHTSLDTTMIYAKVKHTELEHSYRNLVN